MQKDNIKEKKETLNEEEKEKLLEMSEISILINDYEYIFSDFDPRPYSKKSISDDFIIAAKKASIGKNGETLELKFLIPKSNRNIEIESVIKKRLHEHFKKHHTILDNEVKNIKKKGITMTITGFLLMIIAAYLRTIEGTNLFLKFITVIIEPAGWFTTWLGLDEIFYSTKEKKEDHEFYSKMAKCRISFYSF
jgi:hypothetical protein